MQAASKCQVEGALALQTDLSCMLKTSQGIHANLIVFRPEQDWAVSIGCQVNCV